MGDYEEVVHSNLNWNIWNKLLKKARDLDLNKGGVYDARSGVINFWVSPEDKPEGYKYEITKYALKYPRNFLGGVIRRENNKIILFVRNYKAVEEGREEIATPEEIEWCREKWKELLRGEGCFC